MGSATKGCISLPLWCPCLLNPRCWAYPAKLPALFLYLLAGPCHFYSYHSSIPQTYFKGSSISVCSPKGSILPFLFVVFARYVSNLKFYPKPTGFSESLPHILNCLNSPFSILLAAHILWIIISWPFLQYLLPKTHSLLVVEHVKFQESCKKNIHKALAHGILC